MLEKVVKNYLPLSICLFLLSSLPEVVISLRYSDWKAFVLNMSHGIIFAFVISFLISLIANPIIRNIIKCFILLLCSLSFFCDVICLTEFHTDFNEDFISALLGTDTSEISEFIGLHLKGITIGLFSLLFIFAGYWWSSRNLHISITRYTWIWVFFLLAGCLILLNIKPNARNRIILERSVEGKAISIVKYINNIPPELSINVPYEGDLLYNKAALPQNIVIIFGESHCRRHCQFYGYEKETMPRTQRLIDKDSLFVFDKVSSSAINTAESFRSMLSTYKRDLKGQLEYWECPSVFQLMKEAGYTEAWISNQSKHGLCDNLIGDYSELCDTTVFIGDKFSGIHRTTKDGDLVPVLKEIHKQFDGRLSLFFIHLMGNHDNFVERYPAEFNYFSATDYLDYPELQRNIRATYDNSVRYTDWVINEVFDEFKKEDAIIIYCSDHGLDFYYTREDYYHHGIVSDPDSCDAASEIPFLIYPTEAFFEEHSYMIARMARSLHHEWKTEDLIYTVLDLAGISFSASDDVRKYSLLLPE